MALTPEEIAAGRPCGCDRYRPGSAYDASQCPLCFLWHDPGPRGTRRRALWAARKQGGGYATPRQMGRAAAAPKPLTEWPRWARALAKRRRPGDRGLGDTLARYLDRLGGGAWKAAYRKLVGRDCGCRSRADSLNRLYPYADKGGS